MEKPLIHICLILAVFGYGCTASNRSTQVLSSTSPQPHYTASFPNKDVSRQLQFIQQSVLRYTTTCFYETFFFTNQNITLKELQNRNYSAIASRQTAIEESKAGTAIALMQNSKHTAMITAYHVLAFPDTAVVYKKGKNIPDRTYVASLAIKNKQRSFIYTDKQILSIEVIGQNRIEDLALIKISTPGNSSAARPLAIELGQAKDLQLGSFVYVVGYPLSSPMVTRGIVSAPDYDGRGGFLTDALFNHGISGGIIIASRDNFNSFEWIGMAVTASASKRQFLIPDPSKKGHYENLEPYTDTSFVSEQRLINYGLTQATPIEQIIPFLLQHENELNNLGFSVTDLIK